MPDPYNINSLVQELNSLKPVSIQGPIGSSSIPLNTTSNSKYLQGWTGDRNPQHVKAVNQGFWDSMGNALVQTAAGIPLEVAEGIGYLGVGNLVDKVRGSEEEFGNSFSNKMREWNEQLKQEGLPVYTTPDSEGFKPGDYKWWAANAPSIASAISLAIPAAGIVRGLGKLGKVVGGLNLAKKLGITTAALEAGETIGMAALSRHMESMMEGMEVYNSLKEQALEAGRSENEAVEIAARGATDVYNKNLPLIATDILQFGLAFKGFKQLSRINKVEKASKNTFRDIAANVTFQAGTEAGEEATQYITSKESERTELINSKIQKDDYTSFPRRLMKYVSEGDFWTSAFMGALGGAVFEGAGALTSKNEKAKQQAQLDAQVSMLEKATAVLQNDPTKFAKSTNVDLEKIMLAGIEMGRADKVEDMLKNFQDGKFEGVEEDEAAYLKEKATQAIEDLKYLEEVYNDIHKDPTKARDLELTRLEMANRAEIKSNIRFNKQLAEIQLGSVAKIAEERQWLAPYPELLKAETEVDILRTELAESAEKDVIENRIKNLEEQIKRNRDTILTNEKVLNPNFTEKDLNNRLNINKTELRNKSIYKVLSDVAIDQNNKDYDKLQSKEGRDSLKKEIDNFRNEENNKEFNLMVAKIGAQSTFEELKGYKEAAKQMGKEEEFKQEYNKAIGNIRATAPKYDPSAIGTSIANRWASSPLLQEIEQGEISKILMRVNGLPAGQDLTPKLINDIAYSNYSFETELNKYYAKADSVITPPKKSNIGDQAISSNPQDTTVDNTESVKQPITDPNVKNKSAWNLQGQQFGMGYPKDLAVKVAGETVQWYTIPPGMSFISPDGFTQLTDTKGDYSTTTEFKNSDITYPVAPSPQPSIPLNDNIAKKISWEFLNTGQLPLDSKIHFEYDFEDTYNKKNPSAHTALFELAYYKDGNTNNKQSTNRFVVGVLSSYDDKATYETPEAKIQLKKLREDLFTQVQASGNRTGTIGLNSSTKVERVIGGWFYNTKKFSNISDVLRHDHKPTFAIGMRHSKGDNSSIVLETNGTPLQNRITYRNATEGSVYLILEAPNGEHWPYKLYTKKLREIPNLTQYVTNKIKEIKDIQTAEEKEIFLEEVRAATYIYDINFNNGVYMITTGGGEATAIPNQVPENELESFVGELIVQIDVKQINNPEYNKTIIDREFVTTDLNPFTYFHSAKVVIDPVTISVPLTKVSASPVPSTPNTNPVTNVKKALGTPIKGVGSTQVVIGEGKPSLVEEESTYSPLSPEGVKSWFKSNLPQVDVSFTDYLIEMNKKGGKKAWGVFQKNGIILYKGAPKGTEHHEAFHAVFNLLLTEKEKETLLNEARTLYDSPSTNYIDKRIYEYTGGYEIKQFPNGKWGAFLIETGESISNPFTNKPTDEQIKNDLKYKQVGDERSANYLKDKKKKIEEEYYEEQLADDFARYVQQDAANAGSLGYNIRNFFKKLWDFLKSIFTNDVDVEIIFNRINTGYYKNAKIGDSSSIRYSTVNDPYTEKRNVNIVNYHFFQALSEYKKANSLGDKDDIAVIKGMSPNVGDNIFSLYQTVWNGLLNAALEKQKLGREDQVDQLADIINQLIIVEDGVVIGTGNLYELAKRDLAKYGIKVGKNTVETAYDSQTDEKQEEIDEDRIVQEGWQNDNISKNSKDTLSFNVRKALRQVTQYVINEKGEFEEDQDTFGFKKFVNFDEIHNYLERQLADIFNIDAMLARLEELKYHKPELKGILDKLNEDSSLISQFFSHFAKSHTVFIQVQERIDRRDLNFPTTSYIVYNANRNNIPQLLIDEWNSNLINSNSNKVTDKDGNIDTAKAKAALEEFNSISSEIRKKRKVSKDDSKKFSDVLSKFGINISPEVLQKENKKGQIVTDQGLFSISAYESYMQLLDGQTNSFRSIITTIAGGANPYKGDNSEVTTAKKLAKIVARNTPNLHQDTFFNIEGKQVYSYLLPTFINKKIQDFKSQTERGELMSNWWFKSNKWLQELSKDNNVDTINNFNTILLDGLRRKGKPDKKYFDMTAQELDVTDLNMYDNNGIKAFAYYRVPILSDSPQAPFISFKKYNETDVIDALYQLALAERDRINLASNTDIIIKNWNDEKGRGKEYQFVTVFNDPAIDIANEDAAKQAIFGWLNTEFEKEKLRLIENGTLTKTGNFDKTISDRVINNPNFLKEYFQNKVLANAMITQLFSIDLAFYASGDDFQKRNGQIFKFTKMLDVNANWNGNEPGLTYKTIYLKDVYISSELEKVTYNDLISKGYDEAYAKRVSSVYKDVNQTDAQTYITVDRYRKIQIGLGEWNNDKERVYRKVKKGTASDDESGAVFSPIKPFYFGHELISGTDLMVPVQHKNSEVVLLPNLAKKSPTLKKVLSHMESNDIDSVQFTSSVKVGQYGAADNVDTLDSAVVHTAKNEYYGIQQETPEHHLDTENLFGTQLKKLIIADIPNDAKIGKYTKKEITDNYQKLLTANIIDSYNELKEEMSSFDKVQAILNEQVIERNLGKYYEIAIEKAVVNGEEAFNLPLYHPSHAKRFEALLNSVVRNKVTKQKINGGSFVLMSNFGFTDKLKVVMKPEGGVDYMEVLLPPWTKKWFPRKPNGEVDIEAIRQDDPTILDLFGYRIPTEHKYSMKKLKVVGFTPDLMGGVAMLPAEITTIAGEDFDIDKMYVMAPNFESKDGRLKKIKYNLDDLDKSIKEREYTPENINKLNDNEIFVFGSNAEGIHGKGAALTAKNKFGAKQGQAEGLQGNSYAVITKKNWRVEKSSTLNEISQGIERMLNFASSDPYRKYYVTKLGSSLAGYTVEEIKGIFNQFKNSIPDNVILPKEYEVREIIEKPKMSKEQRDNALIDIIQSIWSAPEVSDQILIPGGFETLKKLAAKYRNREPVEEGTQNPILPRTQSLYFERNSNGSQLIGIAANHNTSHAVAQFGNLELEDVITFNENIRRGLSAQKDINGNLISRNLAQFLAAFVDNAKDPVAGDLNLNTFTFDTVALIVRAGYDLETAISFITQPAIQAYTTEYFKLGGGKNAEYQAFDKIRKDLEKNRKLNVAPAIYDLTPSKLEYTPIKDMTAVSDKIAEQQLKVLFSFRKYKEMGESLAKFTRATRNDKLGTRKNIAGNTKALRDIQVAIEDTNIKGQSEILIGDKYPLIQVSNEYGIKKPQEEILNTYFPYAKEAFTELYAKLNTIKGGELTEYEINYVNTQALVYYLSDFSFFNNKEKSDWINKYPSFFSKYKEDPKLREYELMKFLKFVPKENDSTVDRIELTSGATISNEQRTLLTMSWDAMLSSDDANVKKLAKDLVKYSFHTNGLSFTPKGFSHLVPTNYFGELVDDQGLNFRDYLYKLQKDANDPTIFNEFIEQLYRHEDIPYGLINKVEDKTITNKKTNKKVTTSIIPKKETIRVSSDGYIETQYIKYYNNGRDYVYKFAGINGSEDYIYNVLEPLGLGNIFEYSLGKKLETVVPSNKLPKFKDDDFFATSENVSEEYLQINNTKELETKFGLVDSNGTYKSYGKDGMGESSTKAYRRLINDLAKINQALKDTPFKAVYGKQADSKGNLNWIGRIVDESYQMESTYGLAPDEQLNDLLKNILAKLGIRVEYTEELYTRMGKSANAVADITNKLIRIAKGSEKLSTLPEEVGHFAEAYNRGSAAHARLMEIVPLLPEYKQVLADYGVVYEGNELKLKQEAIGKLIGDAIIKQTRPIENKTLLSYLKKVWNDFINLFKSANESQLRSEVEDITGEIAQDVLSGNLIEKESITVDGVLYQLGTDAMDDSVVLLRKSIDSIYKKIRLYEKKALTEFTEKEKSVLEQLVENLNKDLYKEGLLNYVINAKKELKSLAKRYETINRNPVTLEEKRETLKTLQMMNNYSNGFRQILNQITSSGLLTGTAGVKAANTAGIANQLEVQYYKIGKPILANILKEFTTNDKVNISGALDILEKDISWTQRFLDQLAESNDSILNIVDVMAKDAKQRGRLKTIDFRTDIIKEQKELEKSGTKSTQFMYERDFSGALTGNILQEYNYGEFLKQKDKFHKDHPRPKREDYSTAEAYVKAKTNFNTLQNKWYEENTKENPNAPDIIEKKRAEFKKQYTNEKLALQKFNEWLSANIKQVSYFDYQIGENVEYTKYIKELALPSDKYKSQVYQDVQNNPAQKRYYDFVIEHRVKNDDVVPDYYKMGSLVPQVRKDFIERLFVTDAEGKRSVKSIRGIAGETKTTLAELVIRNEGDVDYGLTDENNLPINFLPVLFTKKLKDLNNLSLDFTSAMVAHTYSVNDFAEMSKIIDTLEYTKDVLGERAVKTGKFDPVTMFKNVDEKGKPITIDGKDSLAYKRLVDWMEMTIYGRQSKDEGAFGPFDKGKLVDFVNSFTSLSSLALNLYSGISNITVGSAAVRMEGIAGEFFTQKDLGNADIIYAQELPGTLAEMGQRLGENKLSLWLEHMDTMQNYDRDYRNIDAGRNTLFSRMMKTSSLYFINHAGEHLIQSRLSLALAQNTKVKDAQGNELSLWDAYDVKGNKLVLKEGLTKVYNEKGVGLFRKEEEGQALTERDIIRFINRQNFLNKRLHGIYNNVDKSAAQAYALGRLALMFRKFIKPGWNKRFANLTYNEEGEAYTEGYYTTTARFFKILFKDMREANFSIGKNWNNLTDTEKANIHRSMTEVAYLIGTVVVANVLTNIAGGDDDNYMANLAAYEAYRMYSEMRFFTSVTEAWRIVKSPAPSIYMFDKVIKFSEFWNWNKEITRGSFKGHTRFERDAVKLIPLLGTGTNVMTPEEQLKFYTSNGISIF